MSLCLSMIVKNEAHIIRRCLRSVKPFIDSYSISDTGSTDNTMDIIREELAGIPGVLTSDPWQDFAANRNISFSRATGDYVLFVDADELLEYSGKTIVTNPEFDGFFVQVEIPSGQKTWFPRLLRNDPRWKWQYKVHEYPFFDGNARVVKIDGLSLKGFFDSHQNAVSDKRARLLEILESEPSTPRNLFYLANVLGSLGRNEEAIAKFYERAGMGGDESEVYTALWLAASLMPKTNRTSDEVAAAYFRAYIFRPSRYEALVSLCQILYSNKHYLESYNLSTVEPKQTEDIMLVDEQAIWRILEEHAIAAFYLGKKDEARKYCERILSFDLSPEDRKRMEKNLDLL
jgi:glycosyltransferase involved in cell wall biosynthesis